MRIISGAYKGRPIGSPKGMDTRPTTDRVRESIMSSLYSALGSYSGKNVLDVFAGSGAMSLESLSRGACFALLIDESNDSQRIIKRNLENLNIDDSEARCIRRNVLKNGIGEHGLEFDIVFLDPPYSVKPDEILRLIESSKEKGSFSDECIFVYELSKDNMDLIDDLLVRRGFDILTKRVYGNTYVILFKF